MTTENKTMHTYMKTSKNGKQVKMMPFTFLTPVHSIVICVSCASPQSAKQFEANLWSLVHPAET